MTGLTTGNGQMREAFPQKISLRTREEVLPLDLRDLADTKCRLPKRFRTKKDAIKSVFRLKGLRKRAVLQGAKQIPPHAGKTDSD